MGKPAADRQEGVDVVKEFFWKKNIGTQVTLFSKEYETTNSKYEF